MTPKLPEGVLVANLPVEIMTIFRHIAEEMGWVEGKDHICSKTADEFQTHIFVDSPQLLITGNIRGGEFALMDLVEKLRVKNPQLVVVTLSANHIKGKQADGKQTFDLQIYTVVKNSVQKVIRAIQAFRAGHLRRTGPVDHGRSAIKA